LRIEDAMNRLEFVGYVSEGEELDGGIFSKKGANVWTEQKWSIESFFLPEMVEASELQNKEQARVALIELVNLDTPLDERNTRHYDVDMTGSEEFPYKKTMSGALQSRKMPWDYERHQSRWALTGGLAGFLALTMKVVKK
jgi:hypothetical protein